METDLLAILKGVGALNFPATNVVDKELLGITPAGSALRLGSVLCRLEVCGGLFCVCLDARNDLLVSLQQR